MEEVSRILTLLCAGETQASEDLLPVVYVELRKLASRQIRQKTSSDSFQATELVHEAFLRLVDVSQQQRWDSRGHFFSAAAEAMRRILVERARKKSRIRHGGEFRRVSLPDVSTADEESTVDLLALDEALTRFKKEYPNQAKLVDLRYFAGLTLEDAGLAMGVSRATAVRYWAFAKAWLFRAMHGSPGANPEG